MGGAPGPSTVKQTAFSYTSTKSIFTFDVSGKVQMTVTFLSPVYPDDLVKQSLQFSYVDVKVKSSDGRSHSVQVYMDISGGGLHRSKFIVVKYADLGIEFNSGDLSRVINWEHSTSNGVSYHKINLATQTQFREASEKALWGDWFLSTASDASVSLIPIFLHTLRSRSTVQVINMLTVK